MAQAVSGVGLGLRWAFVDAVAAGDAAGAVDFFEVAPENYLRRGGSIGAAFEAVRARHRLLPHGLMMNLGGPDPLDAAYLARLRTFLDAIEAPFHSDHLCGSGTDGAVLHDLLPLPTHRRWVQHCVDRIHRIEDAIGRPMAVENISYYLSPGGGLTQEAFAAEVVDRAGCGLLLDVNNLAINARNHGFDAWAALRSMPLSHVVQLHVAGGEALPDHDGLVIDTHGTAPAEDVIAMMQWVLRRVGPRPVVYERDHAIGPLPQLLAEVRRIRAAYDQAVSSPEAPEAPPADVEVIEATEVGGDPATILRGLDQLIRAPSRQGLDEDAPAWLRGHGVDDASAAALGTAGGPRLRVYRTLVRRGLRSVLEGLLPRTTAHLGATRLSRELDAWLAEAPPTTRMLREVPGQFVAARIEAWRTDPSLPPHLADLARFEATLAELDAAPADPDRIDASLQLDAAVTFTAASTIVTYGFAVHELEASTERSPAPCPTPLLSYRDDRHAIRHLRLSEVAAAVLTRLRAGAALRDALRDGAAAAGHELDDALLARMSALLSDLAARGVLRGAA